jgi:hypothetical protein
MVNKRGAAYALFVILIGLWPSRSGADVTDAVKVTPQGVLMDAKEPQVALSGSGKVYVTYGAGNTVYCSVSGDGGKTYGGPVKVAEAGSLSLGMRRGPRVAATDKAVVITAVYGQQGKGRDGEVLAWRSSDDGRTWKGPATVSDVAGAAREGLHGMAASPDGTLACAWLDLRKGKTELYSSLSRDGGATWSANRLVYRSPDGTICECCHPSLTYDVKGRLFVMWRNWLGGSRDMYLCRSDDGGRTFSAAQKLGQGTWPLNACPMDGGAVAVSKSGAVSTFWRRERQMYLCTPGKPEQRIGDGEQGWMALTASGPHVTWLERRNGALLASIPGQPGPITLAGEADDPVVAASPTGDTVVIVWKAGKQSVSSIRSAVFLKGRPI